MRSELDHLDVLPTSPLHQRAERAIRRLVGASDVLLNLRRQLEQALRELSDLNGNPITRSPLPTIATQSIPPGKVEQLVLLLTARNADNTLQNPALLRQFHEALGGNPGRSNAVTLWNRLDELDLVPSDVEQLTPIVRELGQDAQSSAGSGVLTYLDNPRNADKYAALLRVNESFEGATADWFRRLLVSGSDDLDVSSSGTRTTVTYRGNGIATLESGNVRVGPDAQDYGTFQAGDEVAEIAEDGKRSINCRNGNCATMLCSACIGAGTLVQSVDKGAVAIEDLAIGDEVYMYSPTRGRTTGIIRDTLRAVRDQFIRLTMAADTLLLTPEHPVFVADWGRFVRADSLRRGLRLLGLAGALATVTGVASVDTTLAVANVSVAPAANYYTGAGKGTVLVHNASGLCSSTFQTAGLPKEPDDWPAEVQAVFAQPWNALDDAGRARIRAFEADLAVAGRDSDFARFFAGGRANSDRIRALKLQAWSKVDHLPSNIRLSIPELQNITDILSSTLPRRQKLAFIRSKIQHSNYEHGIITAPDGSISVYRIGTSDRVSFADLYEAGSVPPGYDFTHNHPNSGTFSPPDVTAMAGFKFNSFTAITKTGKRYTIRRTTSSIDISPGAYAQVRRNYQQQLQVEFRDEYLRTLPGTPERTAITLRINEELDRRILTHFGYEYLVA